MPISRKKGSALDPSNLGVRPRRPMHLPPTLTEQKAMRRIYHRLKKEVWDGEEAVVLAKVFAHYKVITLPQDDEEEYVVDQCDHHRPELIEDIRPRCKEAVRAS